MLASGAKTARLYDSVKPYLQYWIDDGYKKPIGWTELCRFSGAKIYPGKASDSFAQIPRSSSLPTLNARDTSTAGGSPQS
ncbi:hypothetical protein NC651_037547 [Populus alba x Populus x berolinensis]|nr:hypothetical protein NC651_037547 [Populus alba x Populus x berolinensis]